MCWILIKKSWVGEITCVYLSWNWYKWGLSIARWCMRVRKKREKCWKKGWSHDDVSCMVVGQYVLSNGLSYHMSPCVAVSFLQIIGTLLVFTSTKNNVPHAGMEVKSVIEQSMARRSMDVFYQKKKRIYGRSQQQRWLLIIQKLVI